MLVHITDKRGTKLRQEEVLFCQRIWILDKTRQKICCEYHLIFSSSCPHQQEDKGTVYYFVPRAPRYFGIICQYLPSHTFELLRGRFLQISICPTKVTFVSGSFNSVYTNVSSTYHFIIGSLRERKGSRWSIRYFHSNHAIACPVIGSRGTSRTRSTAEEENQLLGDDISKQYCCTTKLSFYAKEICATIIQVTSEYMCVEMIVVSVG